MTTVRLATLSDAAPVSAIHRSTVPVWERIAPDGERLPVEYSTLSLFERWQHGGPWMSIETCAVHLNRLLGGAGIPLVAVRDEQVLAVAEVYESQEALPFGHHLEISTLVTHPDHRGKGLGTALMKYMLEMARLMKCARVTVANAEASAFYERFGFVHSASGRGVRITAQEGRVFYKSAELTDRSPAQVKGWYVPFGRYRSSRQEWDRLFPQDWAAGIPELLAPVSSHLKMTVTGGQEIILYVREADEIDCQPGDAHLTCWSPRPVNKQVLTAIRDWAFRTGYQALVSFMMETDLALLRPEVEPGEYVQQAYELVLQA